MAYNNMTDFYANLTESFTPDPPALITGTPIGAKVITLLFVAVVLSFIIWQFYKVFKEGPKKDDD